MHIIDFVLFVMLSPQAAGVQPAVPDPSGVIAVMRRMPAAPVEPTPRLKDGVVNLGRVGKEKGVWALPVIANFAQYAAGVPDGFRGNQRAGAANEPHIPFQPWAAALYDYNSRTESKFDPEGYCLPPGGPRQMATPFPMEFIQLPEDSSSRAEKVPARASVGEPARRACPSRKNRPHPAASPLAQSF
jgi:hypothetical protein